MYEGVLLMRENTKNKYEKDKSLFESCKDLQNDEVVVTNFDYYRNQIYEIGINDLAFDEDSGKLCNCRDIKHCTDFLFYPHAICDSNKLAWCIKPRLDKKFYLSKFEYDLLVVYASESPSIRFQKCQILMHMKKNGHFMDIPIVLTVNEILENCE